MIDVQQNKKTPIEIINHKKEMGWDENKYLQVSIHNTRSMIDNLFPSLIRRIKQNDSGIIELLF